MFQECTNYPGFITKFRNPASEADAASNVVEFDTFRHVVHKWHFKLTRVSSWVKGRRGRRTGTVRLLVLSDVPDGPGIDVLRGSTKRVAGFEKGMSLWRRGRWTRGGVPKGPRAGADEVSVFFLQVLPQYPASMQFTSVIEKKVVQLRDEEKEKRQDLHILAAR